MDGQNLYFIAVIPAEPLRGRIYKLKQQFSEQFHTYHGLKSPPHITLVPPFKMNHLSEITFSKSLATFAKAYNPFEVLIAGYGAFKPRVVYLAIMKSEPLEQIQQKLSEKCNQQFGTQIKNVNPFHPHMTLAFRDLSPQMFRLAWASYKNASFRETFMAESLFLLKHNGKFWDIAQELPFSLPS